MGKRKRDGSHFHLHLPPRGAAAGEGKNNDVIGKLTNRARQGDLQRAKGNHFPFIVLWDMDNVKPANGHFSSPTEFHKFLESHFRNEGFSGKIAQFHAFGWAKFFKQTVGFTLKKEKEYRVTYHANSEDEFGQENVTDEAMAKHLQTMLDDVDFDGKFNIVALTGDHYCLDLLLEARKKWCGALIIIATRPGRCSSHYKNSPHVALIRYWSHPTPEGDRGLKGLLGSPNRRSQRRKDKNERKAERKREAAAQAREREREAAAERKRTAAAERERKAEREREAAAERKRKAAAERKRKAAAERQREAEREGEAAHERKMKADAERKREREEEAAERKKAAQKKKNKAVRDRRKKANREKKRTSATMPL